MPPHLSVVSPPVEREEPSPAAAVVVAARAVPAAEGPAAAADAAAEAESEAEESAAAAAGGVPKTREELKAAVAHHEFGLYSTRVWAERAHRRPVGARRVGALPKVDAARPPWGLPAPGALPAVVPRAARARLRLHSRVRASAATHSSASRGAAGVVCCFYSGCNTS